MNTKYREMIQRLAEMSNEALFVTWANLMGYDPAEHYAPGITMDEWAMEVYGQMTHRELPTDIEHAQGGGVVAYNSVQQAWLFVANPPRGFKIGDFMPEEWGIA